MHTSSILCLAGSLRKDSYNKKLIDYASRLVDEVDAKSTVIDLNDFELPIYNEDWETANGLHPNALKLKKLMAEHGGLIIASPEYNSSITPVLKNVIDWISRSSPGEVGLASYKNKVAGIISASPGALGGLRGLYHLRDILLNIGVLVYPNVVAIPKSFQAFYENNALADPHLNDSLKLLVEGVVNLTRASDRSSLAPTNLS